MNRDVYNYPVTGETRKADQKDAKTVRLQVEDTSFGGLTVSQAVALKIRQAHKWQDTGAYWTVY